MVPHGAPILVEAPRHAGQIEPRRLHDTLPHNSALSQALLLQSASYGAAWPYPLLSIAPASSGAVCVLLTDC